MKLNEIQDIEVLRSLLKKLLTKCIADVEIKGHSFEKDNWYSVAQDENYIEVYDDEMNHLVTLNYEEAKKVFG